MSLGALALLLLPACQEEVRLGGRSDAGRTRGSFEECGNGIDDDGDGSIDEGCPCGNGESQACFSGQHPQRRVGLCVDGQQRCEVEGSVEFGEWGGCMADVLPGEQRCDGLDEDCDGTIDEGCPCSEGETRACATDHVRAPCRPGTQQCSLNGTWSACEGAVGPRPEVCDDGLDNDCDGLADEGCGCDPVAELCADGLDNDCDGEIDETACETPRTDGGVPGVTWGAYAASLSVPACPTEQVLLVDTTDPGSDGDETLSDPADAGPTLSLVEALVIAENRPGTDTVLFDETVFPADAPGTIRYDCGAWLNARDVCLDARNRGVIIRWPPNDGSSCPGTLQLLEGSVAVGLTFIHVPFSLPVAQGSQLAGCRMNTDGFAAFPGDNFFDVRAGGGQVGPGNVFVDTWGLSLGGTSATHIVGNYFGVDPVSGTSLGMHIAIEIDQVPTDGPIIVEDNVFAIPAEGQLFWDPDPPSRTVFRNNFVGVDRSGEPIPGAWEGVTIFNPDGEFVIGPGNIIRGVRVAVDLARNGLSFRWPRVRITQNRIYGNEQGIVWREPPAAPVGVPTITSVDGARVEGTCPAAGTVEVFHDAGSQGESFVGQVTCDGVVDWSLSLDSPVPSGRNVTATFTTADGLYTGSFAEPVIGP